MASPAGEAPLRLFYAIELPPEWSEVLAALQQERERLAPGYFRWVRPELMHLTLIFLGSQPAHLLPTLVRLMERSAAQVPAFHLSLGRTGVFGPPRAPRVVWVEALQPEGQLMALRRSLENGLRAEGARFDDKPLVPHITLGRARKDARGRPRPLEKQLGPAASSINRVTLFQSRMSPKGPSYEPRAVAALAAQGYRD